jgi:hypothetical protein
MGLRELLDEPVVFKSITRLIAVVSTVIGYMAVHYGIFTPISRGIIGWTKRREEAKLASQKAQFKQFMEEFLKKGNG